MVDTIPYMSLHEVQVVAKIANEINVFDLVYERSLFAQSRKINKEKTQNVLRRIIG
jgi:hypothetical protein